MENKIPLLRPVQPSRDKFWGYFKRSIDAGQLANIGPNYLDAQQRIKARTGGFNCLVANATLGLELALRAKFKPGSRIALPTFTFKATYLAIKNAGMVPVVLPVDSDAFFCIDQWALRAADVEGAVVVSPFGHRIPFEVFEEMPFPIVYDLAGAWGIPYSGPNMAVYSFHATKRMPVGEGGCVVSGDLGLIEKIKWMASFDHTNAKLSELSCAMFCALDDLKIPKAAVYQDEFRGEEHASMSIIKARFGTVHEILNSNAFTAKRYYYPLVEEYADPSEVGSRTPEESGIRRVVALPRDVTTEELSLINRLLPQGT